MDLFGRKSEKQPKNRKQVSIEHKERHDKYKRDKFLSDELMEMAKGNPEIRNQLVANAFNVKLASEDPTKKLLQKEIDEEVVAMVSEDPEMKRRLAEKYAAKALGITVEREEGVEYPYGEDDDQFSKTLNSIKAMRKLEEELHIESGGGITAFLKSIFDSEFGKAVATGLMSKVASGPGVSGIQQVRTYIVRVNGEDREVTESQYGKLAQEGRLQPVAELEAPKPKVSDDIIQSEEPTEEPTKAPNLPEFLRGTDFTVIGGWFEQSPEEFVININTEIEADVEEYKLVLGFLTTATYDGIVARVTPYKEHPEVGALVERILSEEGKEWINRVLELVKETVE